MTSQPTTPPERSRTTQVFLYFGVLSLLVTLASPSSYLIDFSTAYMLKDQLHASASQVANFRLLTGVPTYFAFIFGLTRDLWSPFGRRDRGYFLVFGTVTALVFAGLAFAGLSYGALFVGMLLAMVSSRFVASAHQGLIALTGQEKLMSGRLVVVWQIMVYIPDIIGALTSGWVADNLKPRETFLLCAMLALALALMGFLKPAAVFRGAYEQPLARGSNLWGDLKRLLRHRAIYPAVLVAFMFQFAPGSNTPLQFYLTDKLHASREIYGAYYAVFVAGFIPMFFLYAWLCKRVALSKLLWWGTVITIPQMVPLALIHSPMLAVVLALPIGMMGGIATGAYYDLAIRSCPPGLQGTLMMLVAGFYQLSYRGGDWLGAKIYALSPTNGFLYCVIATTAVYALILPVLLLVPKELIATRDGEANPELDREAAEAAAEAAA
jgi:hypothetical protein